MPLATEATVTATARTLIDRHAKQRTEADYYRKHKTHPPGQSSCVTWAGAHPTGLIAVGDLSADAINEALRPLGVRIAPPLGGGDGILHWQEGDFIRIHYLPKTAPSVERA